MRQSIRIAGQIRRSVFYEGWHGPAVLEVLHGLDAAKASTRTPVANHSIWELVQHMRDIADYRQTYGAAAHV